MTNVILAETKRRTLIKTLIWRVIGVLWTFIGAYLIILLLPKDYSSALNIATLIALFHHSTRMVMYYFHERIWLKISWGRSDNEYIPISTKTKAIWILCMVIILILLFYFLIYINPKIEPK